MIKYSAPALKAFWTFVCERHTIWNQRFQLHLPPPWTKDPVLQRYRFTNVYRRLDRGTIFYLHNIARLSYSLEEVVFRTLVYRLFNRASTYLTLNSEGLLTPAEWRVGRAARLLRRLRRDVGPVFTGAFMVTGSVRRGAPDKIGNYCRLIKEWKEVLPTFTVRLRQACTLKELWCVLGELDGIGKFLAYEIATDLDYTNYFTFSEDDFVNPGPGCRRGIDRVVRFDDLGERNYPYAGVIAELRWHQEEFFAQYDLLFPYWNDYPLTLRDIEHSLCEFSKYMRFREALAKGVPPRGRARRFNSEEIGAHTAGGKNVSLSHRASGKTSSKVAQGE